PDGEITAMLGGSGCGKSTLLRLIAGLDAPSRGKIFTGDAPITAPHADVGIIFQEPRLLPWLTVADNVAFGLRDGSDADKRAQADDILAQVGLKGFGPRWPRELSGGQQQRVAIARALAPKPKVLLLDEPFSALDMFTRAGLHAHLLALWKAHRPTVLMVTHDVDEAVTLADRIVVMQPNPGRIATIIDNGQARPRDRLSPAFESIQRQSIAALDRSMRGEKIQPDSTAASGWW
ncbi:MAG: ABC transporter ATP-binding protein, partial [Beijerinckiaceae bacterium]